MYYHSMFLEGLRKRTKTFSQVRSFLGAGKVF